MGPEAIGAMSSVGASAASGLFGYFSTRHAAKKAEETAQKNREFQEKMADKQRAQALEDRAHAEMYNSPLMERLRREAAGLGPVDDYSTPGTPAEGLAPDYAAATEGSNQPLVDAAMLGAQSPMVLMDKALEAARAMAQIDKDRSQAAESSASAVVKKWNAEYQKLTLQDQVLAVRLQNDYTFQQTQNAIQEGANLIESGKLTVANRRKAEVDLDVAIQTQNFRVEIARQEAEQSEIKTKYDREQLEKVLPKQLKLMDAEISRAQATARLASSQSRRIDALLPWEQKQMQQNCTLLGLAVQSGTLDFDEQVVKHNKFMSHLKEYEDALVASYGMTRKEANWYSINKGVELVSRVSNTALMGIGAYKALSAVPSVAGAATTIKNGGLILAGNSAFERGLSTFGNSMPPIRNQ